MARYKVTLTVEGARRESVEKILKKTFGKDTDIQSAVEKVKNAESRADRLAEVEGLKEDAKGIVEELRDEMDMWYESIPENLKSGGKASEVEEARDALDSLASDFDNLDFGSISFPGMF